MNPAKAKDVFDQLLENAKKVQFGTVSVAFKLHEGKVVDVTYLTSAQTKEPREKVAEVNCHDKTALKK